MQINDGRNCGWLYPVGLNHQIAAIHGQETEISYASAMTPSMRGDGCAFGLDPRRSMARLYAADMAESLIPREAIESHSSGSRSDQLACPLNHFGVTRFVTATATAKRCDRQLFSRLSQRIRVESGQSHER